MNSIISSCTKAKKSGPEVHAGALANGTIEQVGRQWIANLEAMQPRGPASELYQGRSHSESRRAVVALESSHFIVSAGLGLVSADAEVPKYAATIQPGEDNILDRIADSPSSTNWWNWLQEHSRWAQSIGDVLAETEELCLIAMPRSYFAMIGGELASLPETMLSRLRIFCYSPLPEPLAACQMPYDRRLNGPDSSIPGTEADFAARALRHFSTAILPSYRSEDANTHAKAVRMALADWKEPVRQNGARKTDQEILTLLAEHWDAAEGRTTRLLRLFRDDLGIACEQSRFAKLAQLAREAR